MLAKVFLARQNICGPYTNGEMDRTEVLAVIIAANEAQAQFLLETIPAKATPRDRNGFRANEPYLTEVGEIETPTLWPVLLLDNL